MMLLVRKYFDYQREEIANVMKSLFAYSILLILLFTSIESTSASPDNSIQKIYGNIIVRIRTGYNYEDANKALIFGQLAQRLSVEMKYKKPIVLCFEHSYIGNTSSRYFLSFDRAGHGIWDNNLTKYAMRNGEGHLMLNKDVIVLRVLSRYFEIEKALKLTEYAINQGANLKTLQRAVHFENYAYNWDINAIDPNVTTTVIKKANTPLLNRILNLRISRPVQDSRPGLSYYWKNNEFYIVNPLPLTGSDSLILKLPNIYHFEQLEEYNTALVFDTDSTFYYMKCNTSKQQLSTRQSIANTNGFFHPNKIRDIGGGKISICFYYYTKESGWQPRSRTLIYLSRKDYLIQSLDDLINSDSTIINHN